MLTWSRLTYYTQESTIEISVQEYEVKVSTLSSCVQERGYLYIMSVSMELDHEFLSGFLCLVSRLQLVYSIMIPNRYGVHINMYGKHIGYEIVTK